MTGFIIKALTASLIGWLPAATLLLLSACVHPEKDDLVVYTTDPKAFSFWILPF